MEGILGKYIRQINEGKRGIFQPPGHKMPFSKPAPLTGKRVGPCYPSISKPMSLKREHVSPPRLISTKKNTGEGKKKKRSVRGGKKSIPRGREDIKGSLEDDFQTRGCKRAFPARSILLGNGFVRLDSTGGRGELKDPKKWRNPTDPEMDSWAWGASLLLGKGSLYRRGGQVSHTSGPEKKPKG